MLIVFAVEGVGDGGVELAKEAGVVSASLHSVLRPAGVKASSRSTWGAKVSKARRAKQISDAINWWRGGRRRPPSEQVVDYYVTLTSPK